jgi:hypothetical protein
LPASPTQSLRMTNPPAMLPRHPMTARQLLGLGFSRSDVRTMVEEGVLRRPLRGVYLTADVPDSPASRAACAALLLPPESIVCDASAAWILGIDIYEQGVVEQGVWLEVVAIDGHDRARRPELLGGKRALAVGDISEIDGVRLTSPLRTACDIACLRGRRRALAVLDQFCRSYELTAEDFAAILPRYRGRRGCRQLRELAGYADPRAESPAESWTRLAIIDAGLPVPTPQVELDIEGWGQVRLDLAYLHLKIAVEYDGVEFHGEDRREHDLARRAALRRAGWFVLVVRKEDLAAGTWLVELRAELNSRRTPAKRAYSRTRS